MKESSLPMGLPRPFLSNRGDPETQRDVLCSMYYVLIIKYLFNI